jgi:hypothetical protein
MVSGYRVTQAQIDRLQQMKVKDYPIVGLRFQPHEGHITVSVWTRKGMRYFYIGQKGQLKG